MQHEVLIVGGGLAGLTNAIKLAQSGLNVGLIEKNEYPFHRVCGEYISNETLPFLRSLGFDPFQYGAVAIKRFWLTSPKGSELNMDLDMGGFGLSRYVLDEALYRLALAKGVSFYLKTNVLNIIKEEEKFICYTDGKGELSAKLVISAHGKRSNLDKERAFFQQRSPYIGVKYHIKTDFPNDLIALHNFKDGYCGISRVEDDKYCLCYLTTRENLKQYKTIEVMQEQILKQNRFLKDILENATFCYDAPKVINEISFSPKTLIDNDILMCGDSAGMITPLCGNGMAMAIHSSKILSNLIIQYFDNQINKDSLYKNYQLHWNKYFRFRLAIGRTVQHFFGSPVLTELLVRFFKHNHFLAKQLVRQTHGEIF
jgi:flavin-dependent dehydrogenase